MIHKSPCEGFHWSHLYPILSSPYHPRDYIGFSSKWVFSVSDYRRQTWHSEKKIQYKISTRPPSLDTCTAHRYTAFILLETKPNSGHSAAQMITSMKNGCIN